MIKVNLAKRKKANFLTSETGPLSKLNIDPSDIKELPLLRIGLTVAVIVLSSVVKDQIQNEKLTEIDSKLKVMNDEAAKLKTEAGKLATYEPIKKQMEQDEFTIRSKIEAIDKLVAERNNMSRKLVSVSNLIPENVWLEEMTVGPAGVRLKGKALGITTVSEFLKRMRENVDFEDLVLEDTQQIQEGTGVETATFTLVSKKGG